MDGSGNPWYRTLYVPDHEIIKPELERMQLVLYTFTARKDQMVLFETMDAAGYP